ENGLPPAPTEHLELIDPTCKAFRIDKAKEEARTKSLPCHKIPGIKTPLFFYQLLAVLWMSLPTRLRGGCLGQPPGMGKTLILDVLFVIRHHWHNRRRDIELDRGA
ncbi:hypothetical protein GJ744_006157, partial [Endocarpon pusillum]